MQLGLVEADDIVNFTAAKLKANDSELLRNLQPSLNTRYPKLYKAVDQKDIAKTKMSI